MQVFTTTTTNANAVQVQNKHRQLCSVQFRIRSLLHTVMRSSRSPLPNNLTYLWKRLLALRPYWQCQPYPLLSIKRMMSSKHRQAVVMH